MSTTAEKLTTISENVQRVYNAGKNNEYRDFWDKIFHKNDNSYFAYAYMFAGAGWNDNTFKPTYDLKPTGWAASMFISSHITDLTACLAVNNVSIVLPTTGTATVQLASMFQNCDKLVRVPVLNLSKCVNCVNLFYSCTNLTTIDGLVFSEETKGFNGMFHNCAALTSCSASGTLAETLDISKCTSLNKASITSFINILSTTATGKTLTLSKAAVNAAFEIDTDDTSTYPEGSEYYNLINSKNNWTIAYA